MNTDLRFGTWNIKTMNNKEEEVIEEMKRYKMSILGLSEVKKKGQGEKNIKDKYTLRYSGITEGRAKQGVAFITNEEMEKYVIKWEPISPRIITITLKFEHILTLIQIYAPTTSEEILEIEQFYNLLNEVTTKETNKGHQLIIMGDWNSRIGKDPRKGHGVMGIHGGEAMRNENGKKMIQFCISHRLLIGNTFYPHKNIHKITFQSESTGSKSIIDYMTYTNEMRYHIMDVKVYRGAELSTDHFLLTLKYRTRLYHKKNKTQKLRSNN